MQKLIDAQNAKNNRLADQLLASFKTINENFVIHLRQLDQLTEDAKNGYRVKGGLNARSRT